MDKILIYQNALDFLQGVSSHAIIRGQADESLRTFSETMRMDPVLALLKIRKSRFQLLEIANELGVGVERHELTEELHRDEERIVEHIKDILNFADAKAAVLCLKGEDAQVFLNLLEYFVDPDNERSTSQADRAKAHRLILKLSQASEKLPDSLFVDDSISECDRFYRERGGFGEIYRALYAGCTPPCMVALKRPSVSLTAEAPEQRKGYLRFCQEVLTWRQLRHESIVPLLGIDRATFAPYLAMVSPWMEQGTVLNYLKRNGIASVDRLLFEVAQGLAYLHSMNVVHGDLRGANILISNDQHACLTDFGLAVFSDGNETANPSTSNRGGSLQWMAPELIDPKRFGHERFVRTTASDAYAFACVCVELYTGMPPFAGSSEGSALLQIIARQRPARPDQLISDALWDYMAKLWAEAAQARPILASVAQFMGGLLDDVADVMGQLPAEDIIESLTSPPAENMVEFMGVSAADIDSYSPPDPDPPVHVDFSLASRSLGPIFSPPKSMGSSSTDTVFSSSSYASTSSSFLSRHFPRRFFVMKSLAEEDLNLSVPAGMWATQKHNTGILDGAYRTSKDVFLIFSVNKSGEFYGYARMEGPIGRTETVSTLIENTAASSVATELRAPFNKVAREADADGKPEAQDDWGEQFRVAWHSTMRLPFRRTRDIRNPWNHNRQVKQSRDGTELEPEAGEKLLRLWQNLHADSPGVGGAGGV